MELFIYYFLLGKYDLIPRWDIGFIIEQSNLLRPFVS